MSCRRPFKSLKSKNLSYDKDEASTGKSISEHPGPEESLLREGSEKELNGEFQKAEQIYTQLLCAERSAEVLFRRGLCLFNLKRFQEAVPDLKEGLLKVKREKPF